MELYKSKWLLPASRDEQGLQLQRAGTRAATHGNVVSDRRSRVGAALEGWKSAPNLPLAGDSSRCQQPEPPSLHLFGLPALSAWLPVRLQRIQLLVLSASGVSPLTNPQKCTKAPARSYSSRVPIPFRPVFSLAARPITLPPERQPSKTRR